MRFSYLQSRMVHCEAGSQLGIGQAGKVDVLSADSLCDLFDPDSELRQFLLIDLYLDFVFEPAADLDGSGAFLGLQVGLYAVFCEAPKRLQL